MGRVEWVEGFLPLADIKAKKPNFSAFNIM